MKTVLSPKEVLHLKDLGVEFKNTTCSWITPFESTESESWILEETETAEVEIAKLESIFVKMLPAPNFQEVLEKLPKILFLKTFSSYLVMLWENTADCEIGYTGIKSSRFKNNNILQAAYELLCWCAENKHLNNIQQ